ncbi:MAG: glycosyl hydrolase-related protein [Candidatus Aminicenantes bacterium]|nr:glycosyl hydrolase-related protein [Candidatus Aminicenantes bacterium]
MKLIKKILSFLSILILFSLGFNPKGFSSPSSHRDLTKTPTLYVVGYAHLDTQWRWDYVTTIKEYIPKTMRLNFYLIDKYPHYIFNFSGANRYRMMKEYYPADFNRVKELVKAGRWFPCGSSWEESDVNAPSAESIIRQILYGTKFFEKELGRRSAEFMLPDCFGFPASLPSLLAHCGLKGFSTQKLTWGSNAPVGGPNSPQKTPEGIPFNLGLWVGPDGQAVVAAFNPGSYAQNITYDLSKTPPERPAGEQARRPLVDWPARIMLNGQVSGVYADYMYYGTGDTGGSPSESSVRLLEAIVTKAKTVLPSLELRRPQIIEPLKKPEPRPEVQVGDGPVTVVSATAEQLFLDLTPEMIKGLPRYQGDLELTNHSAGSITSQAYMKRWNRLNETLAEAAEKAAVMASWLGLRSYPQKKINEAWGLVLAAQFHDILPGTSIPKAYEYSWNDEVLAMNLFSGVIESSIEALATQLDTRAKGVPVVVFNPLNIAREEVVEAKLNFPGGRPKAVRVFGPDGREVPAQLEEDRVIFVAKVSSVGLAVYDVRPAEVSLPSTLKVTENSLENERYRVSLDEKGDVKSIYDKKLRRELLSSPIRLEIKTDKPAQWPAWNMDWEDQIRPPRAYVAGPAKTRIIERGPARVALEVTREAEGSKFRQIIRLAAGEAGQRVEFYNLIDWHTPEAHLKVVFPLTAKNKMATYNWGVGTVQRPTNTEKQFEVPSHQWIDLTDSSQSFGVTILTDCKIGSDKPNDHTIRLTLLRTPGISQGWEAYGDQSSQDWGRHEILFGLTAHRGNYRLDETDWQGYRLNQPLLVFTGPAHPGPLGKSFSFLRFNTSRVRLMALKKAEDSEAIILRVVEMDGATRPVNLDVEAPILKAREVNGVEDPLRDLMIKGSAAQTKSLMFTLKPYEIKSLALDLAPAPFKTEPPKFKPVPLNYDLAAACPDGSMNQRGFDASGRCLPSEMLPPEIEFGAIRFALGPAVGPNALIPKGQTVALPEGDNKRLYLLAASASSDQRATFWVEERPVELIIQSWDGYIGQWDRRLWTIKEELLSPRSSSASSPPLLFSPPPIREVMEFAGLVPGYIKPAPVAWFSSHLHGIDGSNEPYSYCYLFAYIIETPENPRRLTLPYNETLRILAITVSNESGRFIPAFPLYDQLER